MITLTTFELRLRTALLEIAAEIDPDQPQMACVTYKEIGERLDPEGAHASGPTPNTRPPFRGLNEALGHLSMYEVEHGRPMLSALVVNSETHRPGDGFAKLADHLGFEVKDPDGFWVGELNALAALWSSDDPTRLIDAALDVIMEELQGLKGLLRRSPQRSALRAESVPATARAAAVPARTATPMVDRGIAEREFNRDMLRGCDTLSKMGYPPNRFRQDVANEGAVATVKKLLAKHGTSDGFTKLWEMGRLDMSAEAFVLLPWYAELFNDKERQNARDRLAGHGFEVERFLRDLPAAPAWTR